MKLDKFFREISPDRQRPQPESAECDTSTPSSVALGKGERRSYMDETPHKPAPSEAMREAIKKAATVEAEHLQDTPEENHRVSRVINRDYCKRWALDYAKTQRSHPFTRVSEQFLNAVEAATKAAIRDRVDRHPSKGKTLM